MNSNAVAVTGTGTTAYPRSLKIASSTALSVLMPLPVSANAFISCVVTPVNVESFRCVTELPASQGLGVYSGTGPP